MPSGDSTHRCQLDRRRRSTRLDTRIHSPTRLRRSTVVDDNDCGPAAHLLGELVELRPLREDDWEALFQVASDPKIWEQHPNSDRHSRDVFRTFFREAIDSGGALVAVDRETQRIIGSSRFVWYDRDQRTIEIGWTFLVRDCWGGRYNREMKRLMLQHAFTFARRVVFVIGPDNLRSRRAIERIGAVLTPDREKGTDPEGRAVDLVVYEVLNPSGQPSTFQRPPCVLAPASASPLPHRPEVAAARKRSRLVAKDGNPLHGRETSSLRCNHRHALPSLAIIDGLDIGAAVRC